METKTKTEVEIIQEVIVLHTTRKEAVEKLSQKADANQRDKMKAAREQSDLFITDLLNELSNFGDAVQDSPEKDNDYNYLWQRTFQNIDSLTTQDVPNVFESLEEVLSNSYSEYINNQILSESLEQILVHQRDRLKP